MPTAATTVLNRVMLSLSLVNLITSRKRAVWLLFGLAACTLVIAGIVTLPRVAARLLLRTQLDLPRGVEVSCYPQKRTLEESDSFELEIKVTNRSQQLLSVFGSVASRENLRIFIVPLLRWKAKEITSFGIPHVRGSKWRTLGVGESAVLDGGPFTLSATGSIWGPAIIYARLSGIGGTTWEDLGEGPPDEWDGVATSDGKFVFVYQ